VATDGDCKDGELRPGVIGSRNELSGWLLLMEIGRITGFCDGPVLEGCVVLPFEDVPASLAFH